MLSKWIKLRQKNISKNKQICIQLFHVEDIFIQN